jgi:hypothetical protein
VGVRADAHKKGSGFTVSTLNLPLIAACSILALASTACGSAAASSGSSTPSSASTQSAADYQMCADNLGAWITKLQALDSRLSVGMTESEYLTTVGGVKVEYDRVDFKALPVPCLSKVGVPAEKALNAYIKAANAWNSCVTNYSCSMARVKPKLQASWATATVKLAAAKTGLDSLRP